MDGEGELSITHTAGMDVEEQYRVEYRKGRFGREVLPYGEFNELEDAFEYVEIILRNEVELEELLT